MQLLVWKVRLAKPCEHTEESWSALKDQVGPGLVTGVGKEGKAKSHQLREGQPGRKEALPMEVRETEERRKELAGLFEV